MEFHNYDPGIHVDLAPDFFTNVAHKSSDFNSFKEAVIEAFQDIEDVLRMKAEFDVIIAETDIEQFDENTPPGLYFRGYSLGKEAHEHAEKNIVFLAAPKDYDYWEAGLKNMAVHEEAHQEFFEHVHDLDHVVWESMILEGHALLREKKVREEKNYKWTGDPREYEGSAKPVIEVLEMNREWQGKKYSRDNVSQIFSTDSEWEGIGYVISQEVYGDIIRRHDMGIDQPLTKDKKWLRENVEESIETLYAKN